MEGNLQADRLGEITRDDLVILEMHKRSGTLPRTKSVSPVLKPVLRCNRGSLSIFKVDGWVENGPGGQYSVFCRSFFSLPELRML